MFFTHPEPCGGFNRVFPVFIPFAGCPERCVFCAQTLQTGQAALQNFENTSASTFNKIVDFVDKTLKDLAARPVVRPLELAFYGGTFTALPQNVQFALLELALPLKKSGHICALRCSTRPDFINPPLLNALRKGGLDTIELGVQSFSDPALAESRRHYNGATAKQACRQVKKAGLTLGIQLMPGLPGQTPAEFAADINETVALAPAFARLYPCLVLENTILAELWRQGRYKPWSLDTVLELLPAALLRLWEHGIKVIRLGLAPQSGLEQAILAGPHHPALGQRLRSFALFNLIAATIAKNNVISIKYLKGPRRFQGEFYGHKGELKAAWTNLGLSPEKVFWQEQDVFELV